MAAKAEPNWMPAPEETIPGCPPGLEYLTKIDQLLIHQQVELFEVLTDWETKNRYRVRNTLGQDIYFAAEESDFIVRQCCEELRPFEMSIIDNNKTEVIRLIRPLRCYEWCNCCYRQEMEVQSPPGTTIGWVKQDLSWWNTWMSIQDASGQTVLKIKGPCCTCNWCPTEFQVLSADGTQEVGKISKQWSGLAKEYFTKADNFGIQFPMDLDVKMKAVMLGATFLIDFMFFEEDDD